MPKLLLADDSVTIQRVVELTFSGEDVQVVAVGDGEEAIARIPTERPDIVLADIVMPRRSGYDVAAFVKSTPALTHIPVLLLAGAFEPVDQARADQVRCDGVLVKPFEPQQVIARVRELVNATARRTPAPGAPRADAGGVADQQMPSIGGAPSVPDRSGVAERGTSADVAHSEPRVVQRHAVVQIPDPAVADHMALGGENGDSLDEYFDRLDAALASLGAGPAPPQPVAVLDDLADPVNVPTIDDLLEAVPQPAVPGDVPPAGPRVTPAAVEPPESARTMAPAPGGRVEPAEPERAAEPGRSVIADVFSALLAAEQGDSEAARRLASATAPRPASEDLVNEVTRRVLERLAPNSLRDVIAQIVSEVAERLVREEIARIRAKS